MDPIYYIYHKLYHIFGDHVGHCHQACLRVHKVAPADGRKVRLPFHMHFFCHLLQIKNSQNQPVTAQRRRYDSPVNCRDAPASCTDNTFVHKTAHLHSENRHVKGR